MALKLFIDFDGTITRQDVGNVFFRRFGGVECDEAVREYRAGALSATGCFEREVAALGKLDVIEATRFVRGQEIDSSFKSFVEFCRNRHLEFYIVSDGLDYYIREILEAHGISGVSFFANALEIGPVDGEGKSNATIRFPFRDSECTRCACCKRNVMLSLAGDDDVIGYVGEGYSDHCPVQYADLVFAKDELQKFCQRENISYYLYSSFSEIVDRLSTLLEKQTLPKRRRAEVMRRALFARG
ncbi:MAG: phosphoserine phosphatase [Bacteroidetes bacterium]|nr:phosphoserine phosphatase [Bacteroidota bacterium]